MAILHSFSYRSGSLRCVSKYLTNSAGWRDVALTAMSSAYRANLTWREDEGISLTCRLNWKGEIIPPWASQPAGDKWMWLLKGRFELPTIEVGRYGFNKVWGKIKTCYFVEETVDPYNSYLYRTLLHTSQTRRDIHDKSTSLHITLTPKTLLIRVY